MKPLRKCLLAVILAWPVLGNAQAEDWPTFGRDRTRNASVVRITRR